MKPPQNLFKPPIHVEHAKLQRSDEDSLWRTFCPTCKQGVMLVKRDEDFRLMAEDNCVRCGQSFIYDDIEQMRQRDEPK